MKTSNKLLLAFVVITFSIPFILTASFKAAYKANRYVVKNINGSKESTAKKLRPFKVLKLELDGLQDNWYLECTIKPGTSYSYKWLNYNESDEYKTIDSHLEHYNGDTLVLYYKPKTGGQSKPNQYITEVELEISIPENIPIIVDGATLLTNRDNSPAFANALNVQLTNEAKMIIGDEVLNEEHKLNTKDNEELMKRIPGFNIQCSASEISLKNNVEVKNLNINLERYSKLTIDEKAKIDTLIGTVSSETVVSAPYGILKQLK